MIVIVIIVVNIVLHNSAVDARFRMWIVVDEVD